MSKQSLDQILNELVVPWDTSDLPPNVRITSPSLKIAQAKQAIVEAVEGEKDSLRMAMQEEIDFWKAKLEPLVSVRKWQELQDELKAMQQPKAIKEWQ